MAFQVRINGKAVAEFSTDEAAQRYASTELDAKDVYLIEEVADIG